MEAARIARPPRLLVHALALRRRSETSVLSPPSVQTLLRAAPRRDLSVTGSPFVVTIQPLTSATYDAMLAGAHRQVGTVPCSHMGTARDDVLRRGCHLRAAGDACRRPRRRDPSGYACGMIDP